VVYDGARYVADNTLHFTRFGQFWNDIHPASWPSASGWKVFRPGSGTTWFASSLTSRFLP
jgi:hypothetical protein